jgi:predicted O-methyltransferase YrrM
MDYRTFHERFGGSFRTKHLAPPDWGQWIARRLRKGGRKRVRGRVRNRVPWALPTHSGLPHEFIRLDPWEAEYLFMVASLAEAGIVEIGRYRGGSSFLLACANERRPIYSIDRDPQDDALVQRLLDEHQVGRNLTLIVGDSQDTDYPAIPDVDLLFVDGDHSYEGCTRDLERWYPRVLHGGHVVLHDCYFGSDVQAAVIDFTRNRDVHHVCWPYAIASHWRAPQGSLAHFVKRS